jgi:hypothetical protein
LSGGRAEKAKQIDLSLINDLKTPCALGTGRYSIYNEDTIKLS